MLLIGSKWYKKSQEKNPQKNHVTCNGLTKTTIYYDNCWDQIYDYSCL